MGIYEIFAFNEDRAYCANNQGSPLKVLTAKYPEYSDCTYSLLSEFKEQQFQGVQPVDLFTILLAFEYLFSANESALTTKLTDFIIDSVNLIESEKYNKKIFQEIFQGLFNIQEYIVQSFYSLVI